MEIFCYAVVENIAYVVPRFEAYFASDVEAKKFIEINSLNTDSSGKNAIYYSIEKIRIYETAGQASLKPMMMMPALNP